MGTTSFIRKSWWIFALGLGLSVVTTVANSAVLTANFDFADMADNSGNAYYIGNYELEWRETAFALGLTIGGITLVASGSNANDHPADAFFDKSWGGRKAGLGVCSTDSTSGAGPNSGCRSNGGTNRSDDNVNASEGGETLTLDFDRNVTFTDLFFRDDDHDPADGTLFINDVRYEIDDGLLSPFDLAVLTGTDIWNFRYDLGHDGTAFYISSASVSAVPLPAALPLFGTGMGLLGFFGWRKKRRVAEA